MHNFYVKVVWPHARANFLGPGGLAVIDCELHVAMQRCEGRMAAMQTNMVTCDRLCGWHVRSGHSQCGIAHNLRV